MQQSQTALSLTHRGVHVFPPSSSSSSSSLLPSFFRRKKERKRRERERERERETKDAREVRCFLLQKQEKKEKKKARKKEEKPSFLFLFFCFFRCAWMSHATTPKNCHRAHHHYRWPKDKRARISVKQEPTLLAWRVRLVSDTQADMLRGAPFAFKNSMTHENLQFTLRIAACCVLHRCTSQEIHRLKLFLYLLIAFLCSLKESKENGFSFSL